MSQRALFQTADEQKSGHVGVKVSCFSDIIQNTDTLSSVFVSEV